MNKVWIAAVLTLAMASGTASAKGCVKGAVVGGVVGHVAGKHAVAGAVGGCLVGRHLANKKAKQEKEAAESKKAEAANNDPAK
ncbi:MAG: hypothetical protein V4463_01075 [Pseudomonadota bacterium]